jgi:hypothetical protein
MKYKARYTPQIFAGRIPAVLEYLFRARALGGRVTVVFVQDFNAILPSPLDSA